MERQASSRMTGLVDRATQLVVEKGGGAVGSLATMSPMVSPLSQAASTLDST
jgi:hypothetical protein